MTKNTNQVVFNFNPVSKPRMTQRDKWKKRPVVQKYYAFKDLIQLNAKLKKYHLGECIKMTFIVPMPKSWSKKKKAQLNGQPHQQKPDIDNFVKAFLDCMTDDDAFVHRVHANKIWGDKGCIIVENF